MTHVAQVREDRNASMSLIVEPGRKTLEDLAVNGSILLNCILKRVGGCGLGSSGSALCQHAGCCKHDNEPSSYTKCSKFLWLGEKVFTFQGLYTIQSSYFRDLAFHRPCHTWIA